MVPTMKTSGWLYLATACLVALGLTVFWPAFIVAIFVSVGAWIQRQSEKKEALRRSTEWPPRVPR